MGIQIQATFVKIIQIIIIFYKGFYWPFINFIIILFLVIIDHPLFISRFIGNSLWLIALIYYIYISFLGYSGKLIEVSSEKLKFKKLSFVDFFPAPAHKLIFYTVKSMKQVWRWDFGALNTHTVIMYILAWIKWDESEVLAPFIFIN